MEPEWIVVSKVFLAGDHNAGICLHILKAIGHKNSSSLRLSTHHLGKESNIISFRFQELDKIAQWFYNGGDTCITLEEGRYVHVFKDNADSRRIIVEKSSICELKIEKPFMGPFAFALRACLSVINIQKTFRVVRNPLVEYTFTYIMKPLLKDIIKKLWKKKSRDEMEAVPGGPLQRVEAYGGRTAYRVYKEMVDEIMKTNRANKLLKAIFLMTGEESSHDLDVNLDAHLIFGMPQTLLLDDDKPDSMGGMTRIYIQDVLALIEKDGI